MIGTAVSTVTDGALFSGLGWGVLAAAGAVTKAVTSTINGSSVAHFFKVNLAPPTLLGPITGLLLCGTFYLTQFVVGKIFEACFDDKANSPALITVKFAISFTVACTIGYFALGVNPIVTIGLIALCLLIDKAIKHFIIENHKLWANNAVKA